MSNEEQMDIEKSLLNEVAGFDFYDPLRSISYDEADRIIADLMKRFIDDKELSKQVNFHSMKMFIEQSVALLPSAKAVSDVIDMDSLQFSKDIKHTSQYFKWLNLPTETRKSLNYMDRSNQTGYVYAILNKDTRESIRHHFIDDDWSLKFIVNDDTVRIYGVYGQIIGSRKISVLDKSALDPLLDKINEKADALYAGKEAKKSTVLPFPK